MIFQYQQRPSATIYLQTAVIKKIELISWYQAEPSVGFEDAFLLVDVNSGDAELHIDVVLVLVVVYGPYVSVVLPPCEQLVPQQFHPVAALWVAFHAKSKSPVKGGV